MANLKPIDLVRSFLLKIIKQLYLDLFYYKYILRFKLNN